MRQADAIKAGNTLHELRFAQYLEKRSVDPTHTLRQHLTKLGRHRRVVENVAVRRF